jgi:endonuclease/exonuclease/phosphatase family metal-dependent hydrolase
MRIMSYNIHHGVSADGKYTLDKIANLIYDLDISICLIQELDFSNERSKGVDQLSWLSEMTKLPHTAYGKNIAYKKGFYGNGIISNLPLNRVKNNIFKAKGIGDRADVGGLPHKPEDRGVLKADFDFEGLSVTLAVTHGSMWEEERVESITFLAKLLSLNSAIVGGDFNTFDSKELSPLTPYRITGETLDTYPSNSPKYPIDKFFASNITVSDIFTLDVDFSDHLPLVIEV